MAPHKLPRRATYDDLRAVPDHKVAEILDGELVVSPRPAPRHANASSVMGAKLCGHFHGPPGGDGDPGGWWILDEPELHLGQGGKQVVVPDLAGWRRENLPRLPDEAFFAQAPNWVCEVLSSSTARHDRGRKMRIYARAGVAHVWLLDPIEKMLEIYRLEAQRYSLLEVYGDSDETVIKAEPFDTVALDMKRWWPDDEPPSTLREPRPRYGSGKKAKPSSLPTKRTPKRKQAARAAR